MNYQMENSSFSAAAASGHPAAALVAFSQANEALRLSARPFPPQGSGGDSKSDLGLSSFSGLRGIGSGAGSGLAGVAGVAGVAGSVDWSSHQAAAASTHLLHLQHQAFLQQHSSLQDPRLPFNPAGSVAQCFHLGRYNPASLFGSISMESASMAASRLIFSGQQRQQGVSPPQQQQQQNGGGASAASPVADDGRDAAGTPSSDAGTERSTPDDLRTSRRRKKSPLDPSCCPVCGITLRSSDLESHFVQEIERLERVSRSYRSAATHSSVSPSSSSMSAPSTTQAQKREQDTRWETFHRIRINRTNRVRAKARKRRADEREDLPMDSAAAGSSSNTPCPICGEKMYGTAEELNLHVVQCLRRNGEEDDDDEPLDVEGDSYEEYEWAGQRRVRVTTMLEGGFGGIRMQISKTTCDDEMEDVVVDGDDTATFGVSQFDENDIQSAVAAASEEASTDETTASPHSLLVKQSDSNEHIIAALKTRIHELEAMNKEAKQKHRCLICLVYQFQLN